jgi:hypothetical protein
MKLSQLNNHCREKCRMKPDVKEMANALDHAYAGVLMKMILIIIYAHVTIVVMEDTVHQQQDAVLLINVVFVIIECRCIC